MRRTLDLDHDHHDTHAYANSWTPHDKTRPPTDTWVRQNNKTLTLMITDSHKRNTICTLDMGGQSNCTHCGSACGYRRPSPPELAQIPIEKQQSLAINQAGQINTHSMQLGQCGDSKGHEAFRYPQRRRHPTPTNRPNMRFTIMMSSDILRPTRTGSITHIKHEH